MPIRELPSPITQHEAGKDTAPKAFPDIRYYFAQRGIDVKPGERYVFSYPQQREEVQTVGNAQHIALPEPNTTQLYVIAEPGRFFVLLADQTVPYHEAQQFTERDKFGLDFNPHQTALPMRSESIAFQGYVTDDESLGWEQTFFPWMRYAVPDATEEIGRRYLERAEHLLAHDKMAPDQEFVYPSSVEYMLAQGALTAISITG